MIYNYKRLQNLSDLYGSAFYVLHTEQFKLNFTELKAAFEKIYPDFNIAYSYKTNYIPRLCQAVNSLGGFAEVVSEMEVDIALKSGVPTERIIFNGPYKSPTAVEKLLLAGGTINIDNICEIDNIRRIVNTYPDKRINIGLRVNFAINDNVLSRFGIDAESNDIKYALEFIGNNPSIHFSGIHCHFATRRLDTWGPRAEGMLRLTDKLGLTPERIDLGGGLFGNMKPSLKEQFDDSIPSYAEYARVIAAPFAEHYKNTNAKKPLLLIEPGSALVGDCMSLVTRVQSIKNVRGKQIATLLASMYNINMGKKNPPLTVVGNDIENTDRHKYEDLDFSGFTCIESDYLFRHYNGELEVGDFVVIYNVGSYSIVFKPPFILPNFPIIELAENDGSIVIKRGETFEDIFQTYVF